MNSLREKSLEEMQQEMCTRQKKPRLGRPRKTKLDLKTRRRITALILLQSGRSPEAVAAVLNETPDKIRGWIERGMPVIGDFPERGLSLD